jgi:hypothetical protein
MNLILIDHESIGSVKYFVLRELTAMLFELSVQPPKETVSAKVMPAACPVPGDNCLVYLL